MVVTKGREMIEMECHWSKGTMLQLHRMNKYKDLMDTMMTNSSHYCRYWKFAKRIDFRHSHYTHKNNVNYVKRRMCSLA